MKKAIFQVNTNVSSLQTGFYFKLLFSTNGNHLPGAIFQYDFLHEILGKGYMVEIWPVTLDAEKIEQDLKAAQLEIDDLKDQINNLTANIHSLQ